MGPADSTSFICVIPDDVIDLHDKVVAKLNLSRILRSYFLEIHSFKPEDTVHVHIKDEKAKRGAWSSPRIIL